MTALFLLLNLAGAALVFRRLNAMRDDGRVVNLMGIVRGASQRYVKLELAGRPSEKVEQKINGIFQALRQGDAQQEIQAVADASLKRSLAELNESWQSLRQTARTRGDQNALVDTSEKFFAQADAAVTVAEQIAKQNVTAMLWLQAALVGFTAMLGGLLLWVGKAVERPVRRVATLIAGCATEMESVTAVVASSSCNVAAAAEESTAQMGMAAAALEQLTQRLQENRAAAQAAESGGRAAQQAATGAGQQMAAMAGSVAAMAEATREIRGILQTLEGIAFQANLLALNAAVEAARAGDAGLGFSVVADEVRRLAARTVDSSTNIAGLIDTADERTRQCVENSRVTQSSLARIGSSVDGMQDRLRSISGLFDEESVAMDQLRETVAVINSAVKINAQQAQESAAASSQLSTHATDLMAATVELGSLAGLSRP